MKYFKTLILAFILILSGCSNNKDMNQEKIIEKNDLDTKLSSKKENSKDKNHSQIIVKDLDGNEITLEKPLENVIIQGSSSGGPFMTMMYLDKDNFLSKIGAMDDSVRKDRNDFYTRLEEVMPEISDIARVADFIDNDFSYEAIISLDADGIIAPISYKTQIDAIKEKIDIPVFYIDYHSQDFDKHISSTRLISEVTGLDKNLDELIEFYTSRVKPIIEKEFPEDEKPLVYVEHGYEGEKEYGNSYGSNKMWGKILEDCGAHNIGSDALGSDEAVPLSSEFVLSNNPEKVILTGSQWIEKPYSMKMGYDTSKKDVKEKIELYNSRPGWSDLKAMKDMEVYVIIQQLVRDMSDFYSYEFLAKALHPETYKDLNPDEDLNEFYDKFMPVGLEGTWSYKYGEE